MKAIIAEYHPWESIFRIGNHHYARALLNDGWDVLWISHPVSHVHGLKKANSERMKIARSGPVKHPDGPTELVPLTGLPFLDIPFFNSAKVLENTLYRCSPRLQDTLLKTGFMEPDLLWITDTSMHSLLDIAKPRASAVRIADDNMRFKGMPAALIGAEEKLCERCDVIFVTSSPLFQKIETKYHEKVKLLRNGVDFSHFNVETEKPAEYEDIKDPVAVYVGAIEDWFSVEWVEELARNRKDITVFLIGKAGIDLSVLEKYPNVKIAGPRPYAKLPGYLSHADVGIIPFRRTPLVESVSPIKLFEFFASGLPVVSTSWNELENLASPAVLVKGAAEFVNAVSDAVNNEGKPGDKVKFREYAEKNSWDSRFRDAMKSLGPYLKIK